MGFFFYLLNTTMYVATFKTRFNFPQDVDIEYYHEGEIEDQRLP